LGAYHAPIKHNRRMPICRRAYIGAGAHFLTANTLSRQVSLLDDDVRAALREVLPR
jgi:hypothetical protein